MGKSFEETLRELAVATIKADNIALGDYNYASAPHNDQYRRTADALADFCDEETMLLVADVLKQVDKLLDCKFSARVTDLTDLSITRNRLREHHARKVTT